jgi:hypothetical protein
MERAGRHDDVVRFDATVVTAEDVAGATANEALDDGSQDQRQREPRGIGLEIRGHLVLGRVGVGRRRERHPRKPVVGRRREQAQRVPAPPPRLADALVSIDNDEIAALGGQVVPGCQARLPRADDGRLDPLALEDVSPHVHCVLLGSRVVSASSVALLGQSCPLIRALPSVARLLPVPPTGRPRHPPIGGCRLGLGCGDMRT